MARGWMATFSMAAAFAVVTASVSASAKNNVLYILDASNSMWGQIDGVPKIEIARNVLADFLRDTPKTIDVGVMTYGHRAKDECGDIEVMAQPGAGSRGDLIAKLNALKPKGKTPIEGALRKSRDVLESHLEDNNNVVVISDGVETCEGDPCAAAKELAGLGISTRVHVVGFDLNAEERKQLQCISDNGNGRYFTADNAGEMTAAIAEVRKIAQAQPKPKPAPAPPRRPVVYFEDNFDGEAPAAHWEISGEDTDAYIVENGTLTLVTATPGSTDKLDFVNLFYLTKDLPKSDWTATAKVGIEFATAQEAVFLGVVDENTDGVYSWLSIWRGQYKEGSDLYVTKRSKGKETSSSRVIVKKANHKGRPATETVGAKIRQPIYLRLTRTGRSFIAGIKLGDDKDTKWITTDKVTILRAKGRLILGTQQRTKVDGESLVTVDWLKIETEQ